VFHHLLSTSQFIALLALAGVVIVFIWRRVHGGNELSEIPGPGGSRIVPQAGATPSPGGFASVPAPRRAKS
jgi:hypothetical protein